MEHRFNPATTAVLLIGFQNEFFDEEGLLRGHVQDTTAADAVLRTTIDVLTRLAGTGALIVSTPIMFTENYEELIDPVGVLAAIRDAGAFRAGSTGASQVTGFERFEDRIVELSGKRGLNAFAETGLDALLRARGITHLALAGALTSLCIDSTARSAYERDYRVTVLSDCTIDHTPFTQKFFCEQVFPLYATVMDSAEFVSRFHDDGVARAS